MGLLAAFSSDCLWRSSVDCYRFDLLGSDSSLLFVLVGWVRRVQHCCRYQTPVVDMARKLSWHQLSLSSPLFLCASFFLDSISSTSISVRSILLTSHQDLCCVFIQSYISWHTSIFLRLILGLPVHTHANTPSFSHVSWLPFWFLLFHFFQKKIGAGFIGWMSFLVTWSVLSELTALTPVRYGNHVFLDPATKSWGRDASVAN